LTLQIDIIGFYLHFVWLVIHCRVASLLWR